MTDHYPYLDGDFTVLGPGIVASSDGKTITWRGENYERQEAADVERGAGADEEQGAPVDWRAVVQRRERELKEVGKARHRAEHQLAAVRDLRDDLRGVTGARWIADALDQILEPPPEQPAARHDTGPSVREAAADDRRYWDVEKGGE